MMVRTVLVDPTQAVQEAHLEQIADGTVAVVSKADFPTKNGKYSVRRSAPPSPRGVHVPPNWPAPANFMKSVLVVWVTVLQQRKASDVLYI